MNPFLKMLEILKSDEGYSSTPYLDTKGNWTIGYGSTILYTRGNQRVTASTKEVSKSEAIKNLFCGISSAIDKARGFIKNFEELTAVRQCVLVMMAYQLGFNLYSFKNTKFFIESGAHRQAAIEMLDSKWAQKDSPSRAKRMSKMYLQNKFV